MTCTELNQTGSTVQTVAAESQPQAHFQMFISHGRTVLGLNDLHVEKG